MLHVHPRKLTWNPKSWRFGSDDFPFQLGDFLGSMLILKGVYAKHSSTTHQVTNPAACRCMLVIILRGSHKGKEVPGEPITASRNQVNPPGPYDCTFSITVTKKNNKQKENTKKTQRDANLFFSPKIRLVDKDPYNG